jgi:tetratricopeptide (TPR) repeat protein
MLSVAQLDERIERCLAILADNPQSQVFAALADAYRKRGEFGRAFAVCKSGLKHHPDYAPAHVVMAKLYLHQGMMMESLESLQHAVRIDGPTRTTDQLELEILISLGQWDAAQRCLERMRLSDPQDPQLREFEQRLRTARARPEIPTAFSGSTDEPATAVDVTAESSETISWDDWANDLASRPNMRKVFAFSLEDGQTTPTRLLAEAGRWTGDSDAVAVCAAMFGAIDAAIRAAGQTTAMELRVEHADGEVWIQRHKTCVLGFITSTRASFGSLRQMALEQATRVADREMDPSGTNER